MTNMRHMKQILGSVTFALLLWSAAPARMSAAQAPDDHPEMPSGPGKAVTLQTCTKCHSITNVTGQHKDKDGWTATITKMVGYGATGTDYEFEAILNYVSKYYGVDSPPAAEASAAHAKIVVNKETPAQLSTDLGLTDDEAKAVVTYREKNGDFKSLDDLKKVPNVDAKKFDAKKDDLLFS